MSKKPVVLMVLDGYGITDKTEGNAIYMANTPVMDKLMAECPYVRGNASGLAVGLPDGQMGNSEVGHMNIGAGRIIYQDRSQRQSRMAISSRTKQCLRRLRTARRTIPTFICGDFFPMAVYTATIHICMVS